MRSLKPQLEFYDCLESELSRNTPSERRVWLRTRSRVWSIVNHNLIRVGHAARRDASA